MTTSLWDLIKLIDALKRLVHTQQRLIHLQQQEIDELKDACRVRLKVVGGHDA